LQHPAKTSKAVSLKTCDGNNTAQHVHGRLSVAVVVLEEGIGGMQKHVRDIAGIIEKEID